MKKKSSSARKAKTPTSKEKKEEGRSREQIEHDVVGSVNALGALLGEHDLNRKIREIFEQIIARAESGSKDNAARVLHLALDCTAWLEKRVAADDPLILELAKSVPAWPTLFYPHQKSVSLPSTLATEYEALDVVKLARQKSLPRDVAWRLLRIVDLLKKVAEAESYQHKLEKTLSELDILDVFGKEATAAFDKKMRAELESWKTDSTRQRDMLMQASANLAAFLETKNPLDDQTTLMDYTNSCGELPPKEEQNAVMVWWSVAKQLFLAFTNKHPECCKVLEKVAEAKAQSYRQAFRGKNTGAASRQKSGIVEEVKKAFKTIFRHPADNADQSLPLKAGPQRVKE